MKKNETGSSVLSALFVVIILVVIGVTGWYVMKARNDANKNSVAQGVIAPAADPYKGWKDFCDSAHESCFKYPTSWVITKNDMSGSDTNAILRNPNNTVQISYINTYHNSNNVTGNFTVVALKGLQAANSNLKVLGGYFAQDYTPTFSLVDNSFVTTHKLKPQGGFEINFNLDFMNSGSTSNGQFQAVDLVAPANNDLVNSSKRWFNSSDANTALLIVQSFYLKT